MSGRRVPGSVGLSRAAYNPNSENPHRWWNDGHGLPDRIPDIATYLDARQD